MSAWHGWSADTTLHGLTNLRNHKLVEQHERFKKAELIAQGSALSNQYRPARLLRPAAQTWPIGAKA